MGLVWLSILAIIVVGIVLLILQKRGVLPAGNQRQLLPVERTVFTLEIGDIVQYLDTDWVVEGRLTYRVNGYTWFEYLLQDGDRICWLSVDEDDCLEVALLEPIDRLDISAVPPQHLTFAGDRYRRIESGTASMTRIGMTLRRTAERCQYFDYKGSSNNLLSIEIWNNEVEVTAGQKIDPKMLSLLPGSGQRLYGS